MSGDREFVSGRQTFEIDLDAIAAENATRDAIAESARRVSVRIEQRRRAAEADGLPPGFESWEKHQGERGRHEPMGRNMVTESLTWERVFNGDMHPWGNAQAAQSAAASCGYAFMIFEGRLYTTDRHTGEWFIAPGATRATLAEGAEAVIALRETIQKRNGKIDEMARGHQRLHSELDAALKRALSAEERAERQRRIIDSMRDKLPASTTADKRYAGA